MKKIMEILFCIVILTVYLNIGWSVGTFVHDNLIQSDPAKMNTPARILSGGWNILLLNPHEKTSHEIAIENDRIPLSNGEHKDSLGALRMISSIFWPLFFIVSALSWIAYGIWYLVSFLVSFLATFIFAGGLAELVGVYGMIAIVWVILGIAIILTMEKADKMRMSDKSGTFTGGNYWIDRNPNERVPEYALIILISPIVSIFGIGALLEILAIKKKQRRNRRIENWVE
ncbi:MAG: hypothetical protein WCV80_01965 [Candidatus Paceibacterota bacterium]|jgi:hypothetical protein